MRNNVLIRQLMNLLDDTDLWLTFVFVALAGFGSYTSWISPEFRDEVVLASIAGAVASATGVRGVLLAFAASHAATVVQLIDSGITAAERAAGVNFVPDDLQSLGMKAFLKALEDLKKDAANAEVMRELLELENKIKALWPKG